MTFRLSLALLVLSGCAAPEAPSSSDRDLIVRSVSISPDDASQLLLAVRWVAADGTESLPADLDDEAGVVALDGDRPLDENAVYFDPDSGELTIDLDGMQTGDRTLRVRALDGAVTSPWLEIPVQGRRAVPGA